MLGITFWHWFIFAAIIAGLELVSLSMYLVGPAAAAFVVGVLKYFFPELSFAWCMTLFAVLTGVLTLVAKYFIKFTPNESDNPTLNRRGNQYVGRQFALDDAVVNNKGRLRIEDSVWSIRGPDAPAGTKISITGVDGATLTFDLLEA